MLITTTNSLDGKNIKEYRGIVFGEVTNGINYAKDYAIAFKNLTGGRSTELEDELISTRADAISEMMKRAETVGANAVIGVKIDYENMNGILMVIASGTAVVTE